MFDLVNVFDKTRLFLYVEIGYIHVKALLPIYFRDEK